MMYLGEYGGPENLVCIVSGPMLQLMVFKVVGRPTKRDRRVLAAFISGKIIST